MRTATVLLILSIAPALWAQGLDEGWPREIETANGTVTIYQPQIETLAEDKLEARAAVSVKVPDGAPVFGAIWMTARLEVDRDERLVWARDLTVPQVRFSEGTEEQKDQLARFLEEQFPEWDMSMSLDRLIADADADADADLTTPGLQHDPPRILHATEPTILAVIDGEPLMQEIEGSQGQVERVLNTPFLIVHDKGSKTYYLSGGGELWYAAKEITGSWTVDGNVPREIAALAGVDGPETVEPGEGRPPKIVVSTEPAEMIVTDGEPSWAPVEGMNLLYVDNTDANVFMDIESQAYYVVLSGRWYRGTSMGEKWEWTHVSNNELPAPFADIPEDSSSGEVLAHVAGTPQAREALLDTTIPQTSAIKRDDQSLTVEYDGEPQFQRVEEAPGVQYAINTPNAVFKVSTVYYACDQGVWYKAGSPTGPWSVAASVPDAIYNLPPSNPHYNVTYVKVYDVTPEVVYVGYTPGYVGSYHYHGCVVYGTGWYYPYWWHRHYYPRSWTWGLHVRYNPWTGWGVGISFSNGPFTFSFGTGGYRGAWFGPVGFRPYYRPRVGVGFHKTNININTGDINIGGGNRPGGGDRPGDGNRPGDGGRPGGGDTRPNLYNREGNRDRSAERPQTSDRQRPSVAGDRANDVFTDRDGNVYRRDNDGKWQQRDGGQWKQAEGLDKGRPGGDASGSRERPQGGRDPGASTLPSPSTGSSRDRSGGQRPSTPSYGSGGSATRPQLERDYSSRQRGSQRSNSYSRSSGGSRGGAGRGGGGRRR